MQKQSMFLKLLGMAGMLSSMSAPAIAGVMTFHPESGVMAGNGCANGSSRMYVDEFGDLVIEHDSMRLDLPAHGPDRSLAGRTACVIRVPITLPRGFYVKSIEQRLQFAATKSTAAEAVISTRTAILESINPFTVMLPRNVEYANQLIVESRYDDFDTSSQIASYCHANRAEDLMLQMNLAISGRRSSAGEELTVQALEGYFGEGLEFEIAACP